MLSLRHSRLFLLFTAVSFLLVSCMDTPTDQNIDTGQDSYSHVQQPGSSANDFLADSNFTSLTIEIDYMPGYAPNERALDSLKAFFQQRLHKGSITIKTPTEIPSGKENRYSANEIRNLEDKHRSTFTEGKDLAAYMIIVDAKYEEQDLLGIAYYNTSCGFFGPSYEEASGGTTQVSRFEVEATSFRHEFGHLFGLVAIEGSGTVMQTEHQDEQHGHHCDNDNCLMYYAMETTDLFGAAMGEQVPPLDANCKADLKANGGK